MLLLQPISLLDALYNRTANSFPTVTASGNVQTLLLPSGKFPSTKKHVQVFLILTVSLYEFLNSLYHTPNSFILLNFGVEADFHPAIIDDISLSGKSQAVLSTLVSPLLSEM